MIKKGKWKEIINDFNSIKIENSRNTMDNVEDMDDLFTCKWLKQQYYN